jgi:hypothetical protein
MRSHDSGQYGGLAIGGKNGAVGLARYFAGLEDERAPTPIELNTIDIEHFDFLSRFSDKGESHEQDGEILLLAQAPRTATASGDPAMTFDPSRDANERF